jgi:hypothetical protein
MSIGPLGTEAPLSAWEVANGRTAGQCIAARRSSRVVRECPWTTGRDPLNGQRSRLRRRLEVRLQELLHSVVLCHLLEQFALS